MPPVPSSTKFWEAGDASGLTATLNHMVTVAGQKSHRRWALPNAAQLIQTPWYDSDGSGSRRNTCEP